MENEVCKCDHSDQEREITGCWCTPELQAAVELGYQVTQVHEVWTYQESAQYDGKDPSTGTDVTETLV